jgi:hypothetical protein
MSSQFEMMNPRGFQSWRNRPDTLTATDRFTLRLGAMDLVQFVIQTPVQSFKLFELPSCDLWIIAIGMYGSVIWYMAVR